jgi:hypothetical protein
VIIAQGQPIGARLEARRYLAERSDAGYRRLLPGFRQNSVNLTHVRRHSTGQLEERHNCISPVLPAGFLQHIGQIGLIALRVFEAFNFAYHFAIAVEN